MERRSFVLKSGLVSLFSGVQIASASEKILDSRLDPCDFGPSPEITDHLYQGPFINYGPGAKVKGVRHPINWACSQKLNGDGSLSLKGNL